MSVFLSKNQDIFWLVKNSERNIVAKIFIFSVSTTTEIVSGQVLGHLVTFRVHATHKDVWAVKMWAFF